MNIFHAIPFYLSAQTDAQREAMGKFVNTYINYGANGMSPEEDAMYVQLSGAKSSISYLQRGFENWTLGNVSISGLPTPAMVSSDIAVEPAQLLLGSTTL